MFLEICPTKLEVRLLSKRCPFLGGVMDIACQDFGRREAVGVAYVGSCEKLPPCLIKPVPASSKTDRLMARAKPIRNGGSASGITLLRRGKILR